MMEMIWYLSKISSGVNILKDTGVTCALRKTSSLLVNSYRSHTRFKMMLFWFRGPGEGELKRVWASFIFSKSESRVLRWSALSCEWSAQAAAGGRRCSHRWGQVWFTVRRGEAAMHSLDTVSVLRGNSWRVKEKSSYAQVSTANVLACCMDPVHHAEGGPAGSWHVSHATVLALSKQLRDEALWLCTELAWFLGSSPAFHPHYSTSPDRICSSEKSAIFCINYTSLFNLQQYI